MSRSRIRNLVVVVATLATGAAGCFVAVGDIAEITRKVTYPPDFRYIERSEIQGAMWQMAVAARELGDLIHSAEGPGAHRDEIAVRLRSMEEAAERLDGGGQATNHPLLEWHLPRLLRDIRQARTAVEREPANYLLAASVAGSCLPCHSGRN